MREVIAGHAVEFKPDWHTHFTVHDGPGDLNTMQQAEALGRIVRFGFERGASVVTSDGINEDSNRTWTLAEAVATSRQYATSSDFRISTAYPPGKPFTIAPEDTSTIGGENPRYFLHQNSSVIPAARPPDARPWADLHADGVFKVRPTYFTQITPGTVTKPDNDGGRHRETEVRDTTGVPAVLERKLGAKVLRHTGLQICQIRALYDVGYIYGEKVRRLVPVSHPLYWMGPDGKTTGFVMNPDSVVGSNIHDLPDGQKIIDDIIETTYEHVLKKTTNSLVYAYASPETVLAFKNLDNTHRGVFSDGSPINVANLHHPSEQDVAPEIIDLEDLPAAA